MLQLLHWFQTTYPEYKKALLACHHNFDDSDTNPFHVEGDCWSHTMLVCKIAELKGYDRVVQVSALLHDLGKSQSRKINVQNNHVQFFGHEELSATLAKPLVADLVSREMLTEEESIEVLELISLHAYLYKETDSEKIYKKFQEKPEFLKHLAQLSYCDDFGRFSEGMGKMGFVKNYMAQCSS
jgi:CRISPR/Cas system-associated endonuclease Cas3-HD